MCLMYVDLPVFLKTVEISWLFTNFKKSNEYSTCVSYKTITVNQYSSFFTSVKKIMKHKENYEL